MKLKLISFKTCPYVQRCVITLLEKNVDFDVEYIDLENKPEWFLKISPLGKVPVLQVDNEVLFESAVINEFLDEVTEGNLLPSDSLEKAKMRAWIEYSSTLFVLTYKMCLSRQKEEYNKLLSEVFEKLSILEDIIDESGFFKEKFTLVDSTYAPFFVRFSLIPEVAEDSRWKLIPKITKWKNNLITRESVKNSMVPEFKDLLCNRFKEKGGYIFNR